MKPSNPIKDFHYEPEPGNEPYSVIISLSNWIPVSVIVFANNKNRAVQIVRDGIREALKSKREEIIPEDAPKLLSNEAEVSVHKIDKTQLYRIGWADNDTIF